MAHQAEPAICPKCGKELADYKDVGVYTRIGGMRLVCCGGCRTVLGVLPPSEK
jgi:hypothetical protein